MKKILLTAVILAIFIFPSLAQASWVDDNFDDNFMNTDLWTTIMLENEEGAAKDQLSFSEQNQRLEWITDSEWTDNSDVSGGYLSKWAFVLDQDFEVKVDFHYDHIGTFLSDEGGVSLGFVDLMGVLDPFGISARNRGTTEVIYQATGTSWERTLLTGQLSAWYSVSGDNLYLSATEGEPVVIPGLKGSGVDELYVGLIGWSGGAELNGNNAYFDNFAVTKGHVVPEPMSSVLFLFGGAVFAARRFFS